MSVTRILDNVQAVQSQSQTPSAKSFVPTKYVPTYRSLCLFVIGADDRVHKFLPEDSVPQEYAWCIAAAVRVSDHRDYPLHRMSNGVILANGRFSTEYSPRVDGVRTGTPVVGRQLEQAVLMMTYLQKWHAEELTKQIAAHTERYGSQTQTNEVPAKQRGEGKTERARAKGKARLVSSS